MPVFWTPIDTQVAPALALMGLVRLQLKWPFQKRTSAYLSEAALPSTILRP